MLDDGDDIETMAEAAERVRVPQRFEVDPVLALRLAVKTPFRPPATEPEELRGLLTRRGVEVGPFPGNAAVLAGAGGAGKSAAALALAVQVAGGPAPGRAQWCGFEVQGEGPVVYIAAEDAWSSIDARAFEVWKELKPEQKQRAATRFHVLSLVGRDRQLVQTFRVSREMTLDEAGRAGVKPRVVERQGVEVQTLPMVSEVLVGASALFGALIDELAQMRPALVVLDPLAAFEVGEVETDNGAAGKFMAMLQGLAEQSGSVVMVVHHTTKAGRKAGADAAATNVRGSSALTDNARWVAELRTDDDALTLAVTKNNNGRPFEEVVYLTRVSAGVLREETPDEAKAREELAFKRRVAELVAEKQLAARLKAAVAAAEKGEEVEDEEKPKPATKPKGRTND